LKLNGTHQLLVYADDVKCIGWKRTYYKKTLALVVGSKEIGLEVNADKTNHMVMSRDQNAGRSHSVKTDNCSFDGMEVCKYLVIALTNKNSVQEEIKSRLKSENACYYSPQNYFFFQFAIQRYKD
jgi:hypothetical protein